jgi:hypothetical protein
LKVHQCPHCEYSSVNLANRNRHVKQMHTKSVK